MKLIVQPLAGICVSIEKAHSAISMSLIIQHLTLIMSSWPFLARSVMTLVHFWGKKYDTLWEKKNYLRQTPLLAVQLEIIVSAALTLLLGTFGLSASETVTGIRPGITIIHLDASLHNAGIRLYQPQVFHPVPEPK
jgi:hypothetical protein